MPVWTGPIRSPCLCTPTKAARSCSAPRGGLARVLTVRGDLVGRDHREGGDMAGQLSPWPLVQRGAEGHPVRTLQYLLRARGHTVAVDGIFGPATESAVRAFQQEKHLAVDGIVGPNTWSALIITVQQGSHGDAVRGVQEEFQFRNLSGDPSQGLAVDGIFGPKTMRLCAASSRPSTRTFRPRRWTASSDRHLAGARQRDAVLLITICPHYLPTRVPRNGTATDSGMVVPRQSPKCDPDRMGRSSSPFMAASGRAPCAGAPGRRNTRTGATPWRSGWTTAE